MKAPVFVILLILLFAGGGIHIPGAIKQTNITMSDEQGNDAWYQLYSQGIDFAAIGHEPSWNLKVDKEKFIEFTTAAGIRIILPPVEPIRAQDANVLLYRGTSESGSIEATINQSACTNNRGERSFPFSVRVRYRAGNSAEFTEVEGCGNYVANPRLHNIWAMESLNGRKLSPSHTEELPRIELYAAEGRVLGSDGGETYVGSFYQKDGLLYISRLVPENQNKNAASPASALFNGGRFSFEWKDNKLLLTRGNDRILLRPID